MADKTLEEVKELENAFRNLKESSKVIKDIRCFVWSARSFL